jgi:aminoacyl tRNA synthase complex-interacting multifunctional protein 1
MKQVTEMINGAAETSTQMTTNPYTIMQEIAQACYLEDVVFGSKSSPIRLEISELIERTQRATPEELIAFVNDHMATRLFLCGLSITAADIVVFAHIAKSFSALSDFDKIALPHAFRWIDHVQHLPGLFDQVCSAQLFTSFPDESQEGPSKAQLKKLAKIQAAKEAKEKKVAGKEETKGESKGEPKKQDAPKEESKETAGEEVK